MFCSYLILLDALPCDLHPVRRLSSLSRCGENVSVPEISACAAAEGPRINAHIFVTYQARNRWSVLVRAEEVMVVLRPLFERCALQRLPGSARMNYVSSTYLFDVLANFPFAFERWKSSSFRCRCNVEACSWQKLFDRAAGCRTERATCGTSDDATCSVETGVQRPAHGGPCVRSSLKALTAIRSAVVLLWARD